MDYRNELKKRLALLKKDPTPLYKDTENTLASLCLILRKIDSSLSKHIENIIKEKKFDSNLLEKTLSEVYLSVIESNDTTLSDKDNSIINKLDITIENIKGVGDKLKEELLKIGIKTVSDVLLFFPNKYEYVSTKGELARAFTGKYFAHEYVRTKYNKNYLFVTFKDNNNKLFGGVWFHYNNKYPLPLLKSKKIVHLYGEVGKFRGLPSVIHPEFIESNEINSIRVKYPLGGKIKNKTFVKILKECYDNYSHAIYETLPEYILKKYSFFDIKQSLKNIHFPEDPSMINSLNNFTSIYQKRFIFEELFYLHLGLLFKKNTYKKNVGVKFNIEKTFLEQIKPYLPFKLTNAQRKVLVEIFRDMASVNQMNRLIQGDVGSGKTIVAFIAALVAILNGYQVAVIAPTEILAEQHFFNFNKLIGKNFTSLLLTSSVKKNQKEEFKEIIKKGDVDFVFGTHALIQEDVVFHRLGLAIIDEQHRFGVLQRKALSDKGYNPDILLMSATPIPRTLALTLYGDLDVSIIDELPPGRKPIKTKIVKEEHISQVYEFIKKELEKGNQAYIVYPLINESEVMDLKAAVSGYENLQKIFGSEYVGLLHGKMKADEKNETMQKFKDKKIKILVSTTVIEVGVDIPDATIMVIEDAYRFGIAQLHQLRGRIGRSDKPSYCFLIYNKNISDDAYKRISAVEKYQDGFKLAEIDLEMRGPGDFFGTRQSGLPAFKFANIIRDMDILIKSRTEAAQILENDPFLEKSSHTVLKQVLAEKWKREIDFLEIG